MRLVTLNWRSVVVYIAAVAAIYNGIMLYPVVGIMGSMGWWFCAIVFLISEREQEGSDETQKTQD